MFVLQIIQFNDYIIISILSLLLYYIIMLFLQIIKFNDYIEVTPCHEYDRRADKPWTRLTPKVNFLFFLFFFVFFVQIFLITYILNQL